MAEHAVQNNADALFAGGRAQGGELLVGAQQRVGLEVVGRVVAVVGVCLKDRVEVDAADAELAQVGQLLLDAREIAAVVVHVQVAFVLLIGPEIRLARFVGAVDAVGKRHGFVGHALAEAVGEDLVHRGAAEPARRGKARFIHRQLPAGAARPAQKAFAAGPAVDLAEVGVQIKIVKVQPRRGGRNGKGEMVGPLRLAGKLHAVVHRVLAVLGQHQVRVHIAEGLRHREAERDVLPGRHRAERRFAGGVQTVKKRVRHTKPLAV